MRVREVVVFVIVGALSTVVSLGLFVVLRHSLGPQQANLLSILLATGANTAANRRFTFGVRGRRGMGRHQMVGVAGLGIGLLLTSGSLAVLHVVTDPARSLEVLTLAVAGLVAAVVRFFLLRHFMVVRAQRTRSADRAADDSRRPDAGN